jgi:itaconate CoA-transferase
VAGPLDGLLVVALEQAVAAPMCTVRLADAGARVIKVERSEGEMARHYDRVVAGTSAYFAWLNRGKQSIVLDLKGKQDRALLETMLGQADVFIQNFAPGAAARMELSAPQLTARFDRLIAVDICGYNSGSAYGSRRAYDMLIQAETGICAVTGTQEEPCKVGVSIADITTGMNAHAAILEALIERQNTGRGRAIEISLFDTMADWMSVPLLHYEMAGQDTPRTGLSHASIYPYSRYACKDGDIVVAVQNAQEWKRFCAGVLGDPTVADRVEFADNPSRVRNRALLGVLINAVLAKMSVKEVSENLSTASIAWARPATVPQVLANPALRRVPAAVPGGSFSGVASPLRPEQAHRMTPEINEHGASIRREFAL